MEIVDVNQCFLKPPADIVIAVSFIFAAELMDDRENSSVRQSKQ